jgi:hypothetical protein
MGLDRSDYIIYGYKLPKDIELNLWDNKFRPMIEGHKGEQFTIIEDKYIVFGICMARSDEGWNFVPLDFKDVEVQNAQKIKTKYYELFGTEPSSLGEPELFIFSNYS